MHPACKPERAFPSAWDPCPRLRGKGGKGDAEPVRSKEDRTPPRARPQYPFYREQNGGPESLRDALRVTQPVAEPGSCLHAVSPQTPGEAFAVRAAAHWAGAGRGAVGGDRSPSRSEGGGGAWGGAQAGSAGAQWGAEAGACGRGAGARSCVGPGQPAALPPGLLSPPDQHRAIDGVLSTFQASVIFVDSV